MAICSMPGFGGMLLILFDSGRDPWGNVSYNSSEPEPSTAPPWSWFWNNIKDWT